MLRCIRDQNRLGRMKTVASCQYPVARKAFWVLTTGYWVLGTGYMFACIYIPNFSVAAVLRAEPELQSHAVAIFEGKPPIEKIIAVNEKAREQGISPGMTKAQAELCPGLALRPRSTLQESSAHAAMLDCA